MNEGPPSKTAETPKTAAPAQMNLSSSRFRSLADPESLREFVRNLREGIYITSAAGVVDRWGVRGHGRPGERKAEINACAQRF